MLVEFLLNIIPYILLIIILIIPWMMLRCAYNLKIEIPGDRFIKYFIYIIAGTICVFQIARLIDLVFGL